MKGSKAKKCGSRCANHSFSMKHLHSQAYFRQDVNMNLCPKQNVYAMTPFSELHCEDDVFPQFNTDGKAYTPAFILPVDRKYYLENEPRLYADHVKKIREYTDQKEEILFPKPSRKHKYCSVCRANYDDYRDHIASAAHKKCISQSRYNSHILDLCKDLFGNQYNKEVICLDDKEFNHPVIASCFEKKHSASTTNAQQFQPTIQKKRKTELETPIPQPVLMPYNMWGGIQMMYNPFLNYYGNQGFNFFNTQMNPFLISGAALNPIVLQ